MNRGGWRWATVGIGVLLILGAVGIYEWGAGSRPALPPTAASPEGAGVQPGPAVSAARALLHEAQTRENEQALIEARRLYEEILEKHPNSSEAALAQERVGALELRLLLSPTLEPDDARYTVEPGDTLFQIARKHKTTVELIRTANRLSGDLIRAGQILKIPRADFHVIIDKSQNTLTLKDGERVLKVYRCSTGEGGITPVGEFKIVSRLKNPAWKGVVPPDDPENPLGSRWLGFDLPQYGIHGTNEPETIGQPVTRGCVRLTNADVEELYTLLPEGTPVKVVE